MRQARAVLIAGCLAILAGCGGKSQSDQPVAQRRGSAKGRFFVCIMDVSASMKQYDRNRYAEQGAQLAVSLLGQSSNFATVAFSSGAWVQVGMTRILADDDRAAIQSKLSGIPRQGSTNFVSALATARRLILESMSAESTGAILFLTDGEQTVGGKLDDVAEEAAYYAAMNWPIYTIGLSEKADTGLLKKIAATTGGAHFSAPRAEDLLGAFADVVSITEGYFVKRGTFGTVTVMPDTKRLVFLVAKGSAQAGIGDVTLKDGQPKSRGEWRYPGKTGDTATAFDLVSLDTPEPGTWRADTVGEIKDWVVLQRLPFDLSIVAQQPRTRYVEGQAVHLAMLAQAEKRETLVELHEHAKITGTVTAEGIAEALDTVKLETEAGETPTPLVFHGTTPAKLAASDKEDVLTADFLCELIWGEQEVWTHKKKVSFLVVPATGLFAVQPESLDFGAFWSDSKPGELKMSVLSNQEQALFHVAPKELKAVSCAPKLLEVGASEEREVVVSFDPSQVPTPGEVAGEVTVTLDIGDVSGKTWTESVKVAAGVFALDGDRVVELPDTPPGFPLTHALPHKVRPESPLKFELSELVHTTLGPDEVRATLIAEAKPPQPAAAGAEDPNDAKDTAIPTVAAPTEAADAPAVAAADGGVGAASPSDAPSAPVDYERIAVRLKFELVPADGATEIRGEIPLEAPAGYYLGTLTASIPGDALPARPSARSAVPEPMKLKVLLAVGDMRPRLSVVKEVDGAITPLTVIAVDATKRGWAEVRMQFVLKHADRAEVTYEKLDLTGPGGATISNRFLVQTVPQGEWDGKTIVLGGKHELVYRVFATSDLVRGTYRGELPVKLIRNNEVAMWYTIPITVDVNLE